MSERKVLNKYYPPDFDPTKLKSMHLAPEGKNAATGSYVVRMMLPMSVRCSTCGNFLYIGTKFNMRKETVHEEQYLGIKIYRFYFKCTRCSNILSMKTDPKNSDYVCEHGGVRNYEPWKDMESSMAYKNRLRSDQEAGDSMKELENRTYNSKREMDILDTLNDAKLLNRRLEDVNTDSLISMVAEKDNVLIDQQYIHRVNEMKYKRIRGNETDPELLEDITIENIAKNTTINKSARKKGNSETKEEEDDDEDNPLFTVPQKRKIPERKVEQNMNNKLFKGGETIKKNKFGKALDYLKISKIPHLVKEDAALPSELVKEPSEARKEGKESEDNLTNLFGSYSDSDSD